MAFDWSKYLDLARLLMDRSEEESHRSAISRAYYAAFGSAMLALSTAGHKVPVDGSAHEYVWSAYQNADDGPLFYIGQDGARLRKMRRIADYESGYLVSRMLIERITKANRY